MAVLRAAGIEPRPSLLPFTPWTRPEDVFALLDLVARCDLVGNVDPVQYAIRLLVPPGSLLVTSGRLDGPARRLRRRAPGLVLARARPPPRRPPGAARRHRRARRRRASGRPRSPTTPCAPPRSRSSGSTPATARRLRSPTRAFVRPSRPTSGRGSPRRGSAVPSRAVPRWRPSESRTGLRRRSPWAESEQDGHGSSNHPGNRRQGEGSPRALARRPRGRPRMGELPRPRRGTDVAVRRHLPREPLDVHLRQRLPGRAHGPGPRVGPGMLLLRGAFHQCQGRPAGRGGGGHPDARAVAVPRQGPAQARRPGPTSCSSRSPASSPPAW